MWIHGCDNPADSFTKPVLSEKVAAISNHALEPIYSFAAGLRHVTRNNAVGGVLIYHSSFRAKKQGQKKGRGKTGMRTLEKDIGHARNGAHLGTAEKIASKRRATW